MLVNTRKETKRRRTLRTRAKIFGTSKRPRLVVFRSNRYTYAQLIDDVAGRTLCSIDSDVKSVHAGRTKMDAAFELGKRMAELAKKRGITEVVFDKGPYKYHGRVRSLAEGAREGGLIF